MGFVDSKTNIETQHDPAYVGVMLWPDMMLDPLIKCDSHLV